MSSCPVNKLPVISSLLLLLTLASSALACQQSVVVSAEYCHQLLSVLSSQCRYLVVCVIHFVWAASNAAEGGLVFCQCFFFLFFNSF